MTPEFAFASTWHRFHRDRFAALIDAGLDFALEPGMTLRASYSGQIASDLTDNAVKGLFTWLLWDASLDAELLLQARRGGGVLED